MKIDLGRAIKRATTVSSEMKKGWGGNKKKPVKQKPPSMSQAEKDRIRIAKHKKQKSKMYPPKKTKKILHHRRQHSNEVLGNMGLRPLSDAYWAKEMERFIN